MTRRYPNFFIICLSLVLSILFLPLHDVKATENGVNSGAIGAEDFMTGALPPSGFYYLNYLTYYSAGTLKDNDGNKVPGKFSMDALADINRFVYITKAKILGADYGVQLIVPLANLNLSITTPGGPMSDTRYGIADIVVTPVILGWHTKNFHWVFAIDTFLPTGPYDKTKIVNVGRNYYSTELAFAFTYLSDIGIEFSSKLMYDINFRNTATDYTSGNEFHMDAILGYHLGKQWKLGVNAYYYKQLTDDTVGSEYTGPPISNGNRGQVFGLGPAVGFEYNHIHFALKYQKEMSAANRLEGDRLWFKVAIPF
jgi:hypothetical protein